MHRLSYLPNLLSSLRIALAPAMLGAAYSNSKVGFSVLLATALITDALDGEIARRWRVESELGARLDRWGDGLTTSLGALGVFFLWPAVVEREWPWALVAVGGYSLVALQRLMLPAGAKTHPGWIAKLLAWLVPASLVPLINGWAEWPWQAAVALQAALALWRLLTVNGAKTGGAQEAAA